MVKTQPLPGFLKICKKCGGEFPKESFYFNKKHGTFSGTCKECTKKAVAEYKEAHYGYWRKYYVHKEDPWACRRKPVVDGKIRCAKCKEWLPVDSYWADKCYCKSCLKEHAKKYKRDPVKRRAYYKVYRAVNKDYINQYHKEWYEKQQKPPNT